MLHQTVDTGAGDSSCKNRGKKIHLLLSPSCLSEFVILNQQLCLLPFPHPVFTETKTLAIPPSPAFPFCPSVAADLLGSSQLIEIEWNSNETAGCSYGLDFDVV